MKQQSSKKDIYRGRDPSEIPSYTMSEAAHWLDVSPSTVRAWTVGQRYRQGADEEWSRFEPVIQPADSKQRLLSFLNLIELHVLAAIRRQHGISLQNVRKAVTFLERQLKTSHPLATQRMLTDGRDLLVRHGVDFLNASKSGQVEMGIVDAYLQRIEFGDEGKALRLYPFTRVEAASKLASQPRTVVIDPRIQFGKPCLVSSDIPTFILAERFKAGDDPTALAKDYGRTEREIWEAIRYEFPAAA